MGNMKRLLIIPFLFLLFSCSSKLKSPFSTIKTIKCEQKVSSEFGDHPSFKWKESNFLPDDGLVFDKKTGQIFLYDDFKEELYPDPASYQESIVVNGKLKIKTFIDAGDTQFDGLLILDLKNLKGKYKSTVIDDYIGGTSNFKLRCEYLKNKTNKIKAT